MKKITRIFHLLLTLSLVLLPMRAVMADFSVMPVEQVAGHHAGAESHHADMNHEFMAAGSTQADEPSTDCHDHNMTDCEACSLHCALKKDVEISELSTTLSLHPGYSVPVVALVLSSEIRPPIS